MRMKSPSTSVTSDGEGRFRRFEVMLSGMEIIRALKSPASEASPQSDEECVASVRRTPAVAPLCGGTRVHSRIEASVAVGWPSGEPVDRSPSRERSTKRRRSVGRAHDAGARMHRPDVPERVRASGSDRGGRVVLSSPDPRQSNAFVGADGTDVRGRLGDVWQA